MSKQHKLSGAFSTITTLLRGVDVERKNMKSAGELVKLAVSSQKLVILTPEPQQTARGGCIDLHCEPFKV